MQHHRHLIPLLVAVLITQGLAGVVPHSHRPDGFGTEVARAERDVMTTRDAEEASHDCLACSVHAPVVEFAADRGLTNGVEQASPIVVTQWSASFQLHLQSANPRGPPWFV